MGYFYGVVALFVAGPWTAVTARSIVRRVSVYEPDDPSSEPAHCVVWGEKQTKGIKFSSKADAAATFNALKRTEMVVAHYKGLVEVQRHTSSRLTSVSWRKLRKWCTEEHPNAEQPKLLQEDRPSEEPVTLEHVSSVDDQEPLREEQATLDEMQEHPSPKRRRSERLDEVASLDEEAEHEERHENHQRHGHKRDRIVTRNHRDSSIDDDAQPPLQRKRSRQIASLDDDSELEEHHERRPRQGHQLRHIDRIVTQRRHKSPIDDDDEQPRHEERPAFDWMQEQPAPKKKRSRRTLEFELLGDEHAHREHHERRGHHEHARKESSLLGKGSLASKIASLDREVGDMLSEAAALAKRMGTRQSSTLESAMLESDSQGEHRMILKDRIAKMERSLSNVHTVVSSLEIEVLGHSGTLPKGKKSHGLKNKAVSLEGQVKNMRERMVALKQEANRAGGQLDKLEASMNQLSSKAAALFQSLGNADAAPSEQQQPDQDASFLERLNLLESSAETLRTSVGSLEVELLGAEARAPPKSAKAEHINEKLKFLQAHMKSLNGRLTSLEQEV